MVLRIRAGQLAVRTTATVVFETVFTLQSFYRVPRSVIRQSLGPLLALPGVRLRGKRRLRRAFDLYVSMRRLSFADCYHVAYMESQGLTELVSFDRGFDRIPTITRKEPDATGVPT
jgi:predicted nucleic acid-binding protein